MSHTSAAKTVQVYCRFRPIIKEEVVRGETKTLNLQFFNQDGEEAKDDGICDSIMIDTKEIDGGGSHKFHFKGFFPYSSNQEFVYQHAAGDLPDVVLNGFNSTIFAYGQTGSGKTHTMLGPVLDPDKHKESDQIEGSDGWDQRGLIPRVVEEIFAKVTDAQENKGILFSVEVTYVELYLEKIHDLLKAPGQPDKEVRLREDKHHGVYMEGTTRRTVKSPEEFFHALLHGTQQRTVSSTLMNNASSRSHCICSLTVHQRDPTAHTETKATLHMVDLAGSESVKKTHASGNVLREAKMINKSLSALGNVINALADKSHHVPYRDSKLTRILQNSLGGNAHTVMITACSSSTFNIVETLSTLRFGFRAMAIKNQVKQNKQILPSQYKVMYERSQRIIEKQNAQILELQTQLEEGGGTATTAGHSGIPPPKHDDESHDAVISKLMIENEKLKAQVDALKSSSTSAKGSSEAETTEENSATSTAASDDNIVADLDLKSLHLSDDDNNGENADLVKMLKNDLHELNQRYLDLRGHYETLRGEHKMLEGKSENELYSRIKSLRKACMTAQVKNVHLEELTTELQDELKSLIISGKITHIKNPHLLKWEKHKSSAIMRAAAFGQKLKNKGLFDKFKDVDEEEDNSLGELPGRFMKIEGQSSGGGLRALWGRISKSIS
eukprot:g1927.t1